VLYVTNGAVMPDKALIYLVSRADR
jgi:hypothetical protein